MPISWVLDSSGGERKVLCNPLPSATKQGLGDCWRKFRELAIRWSRMSAKAGHKQWKTKSSKLYRSALEHWGLEVSGDPCRDGLCVECYLRKTELSF